LHKDKKTQKLKFGRIKILDCIKINQSNQYRPTIINMRHRTSTSTHNSTYSDKLCSILNR